MPAYKISLTKGVTHENIKFKIFERHDRSCIRHPGLRHAGYFGLVEPDAQR
jgi:hypothetical protein